MSQDDLVTALSGLTPAERIELLQLLEIRDREPVFEDPRPSFDELLRKFHRGEATRAGADVEAYCAACTAYHAVWDKHMSALGKHPLTEGMSMDEYFTQGRETWLAASRKAAELAAAEGCPHPDLMDFVLKPAADDQPAITDIDDFEPMPAGPNQARRPPKLGGHPARSHAEQPHDKLGPFRGRDTSTEPGVYEDN